MYFREGEELAAALRVSQTKLTEWFKANNKYPGANHLRYDDFPRLFIWDRSDKLWKLELNSEEEELAELGHYLEAPLYLQNIIVKSLEKPS